MGYARTPHRWSDRFRSWKHAVQIPGTPVPGSGGHHSYSRRRGGGNKIGAITRPNKEWGSQARKQEEHQTGIAKRAEMDSIQEQLDDLAEPDDDFWNMGLVDEVDHPDTTEDWLEDFYDFTADVEEIDHDYYDYADEPYDHRWDER